MGVIYLLYNDAGYGYIGQTTDIKGRIRNHKNNKTNTTASKLLGKWKCEVLEEVEDDCLEDFERYWYNFYNEIFPNMLVNIDTPLQTQKEWRAKNKERLLIKNITWNRENKERRNEKILCECGKEYTKTNKLRHFQSAKHQNFIQPYTQHS